ncbi:MAG TPA: signal peptidase I [Candidatus Azoamicus sp.]
MTYKKILSKEYIEIYIILILILIMRIMILEPFRIPSGSMQPTLLIGDFIFVNKFIYGINIPIINKNITIKNPQRGDIIVFKKNDKKNYIKRLIGIEGDKIIYKNKIYIYK